MERGFGKDFSHVRIHRNELAAASARAVRALAYTVGRDIVFGAGQYDPESLPGQQLVAHELAHVLQQGGGAARGAIDIDTNPKTEAEATRISQAVVTGHGVTFSARSTLPTSLARQATPGSTTVGSASVGASATLPEVPAPSPLLFPKPGSPLAAGGPALPSDCPSTGFFGDSPSRAGQTTSGAILNSAEVSKRRADIASAVIRARTKYPLAADNLQHWLDNTGTPFVMPGGSFLTTISNVPYYLQNSVLPIVTAGVKDRVSTGTKKPSETLRPSSLSVGAAGAVRFLSHRDSNRGASPALGSDLFYALNLFSIHSVLWAQATYLGKTGGFLGIGAREKFEINILKWCVQVYDVYDWNLGAVTPFPVNTAMVGQLPIPPGAATITSLGPDSFVFLKDQYFRDLEVSGGGRAYLVRSETFAAPASVTGKIVVEV